jgi:NitT/TauT family transport system permease protein
VKAIRALAAPVAGVNVFAAVWELAVRALNIRRFVLLAPSAIVAEFAEAPRFYLDQAAITGRHMVIGLSISLVVAVVIGSVMAASRFIEEATQPVLVLILVTPWVAYITSVVIWLGFGERPIIFMVAFTSLPVFVFGVVGGMKSADPAARELFASVDAKGWEVLWRLRLPAALPSIFTTARFAIGLGLAAAYFSEGSALSNDGLGALGRRAALDQTTGAEVLWTTILCSAMLGILGLTVIAVLERTLLRWHASQRR